MHNIVIARPALILNAKLVLGAAIYILDCFIALLAQAECGPLAMTTLNKLILSNFPFIFTIDIKNRNPRRQDSTGISISA